MSVILETERLILREFAIEDYKFIIDLLNSEGWIQYIGDRNIKTDVQAKEYLSSVPLKSYKDFGYGLWLVERKSNQEPIGMCGLINRNYLEFPDIGFAFLPDYQRMGYAYEITKATLIFAKVNLKMEQLAAITLPNNTHSVNLLKKLGFEFQKTIAIPVNGDILELYNRKL